MDANRFGVVFVLLCLDTFLIAKTEKRQLAGNPVYVVPRPTNDSQTVSLTWRPLAPPHGPISAYTVFVSDQPLLSVAQWLTYQVPGDQLSTEIDALKPATYYYFRVRAHTARGAGRLSDVATYYSGGLVFALSPAHTQAAVGAAAVLQCAAYVLVPRPVLLSQIEIIWLKDGERIYTDEEIPARWKKKKDVDKNLKIAKEDGYPKVGHLHFSQTRLSDSGNYTCVALERTNKGRLKERKESSVAILQVVESECQPSEFACATSDRCIDLSWRCDGEVDCADSSDETGCPGTTCSHSEFRCSGSGQCVPTSWRCDGADDCQDAVGLKGSDEEGCLNNTTPRPKPESTCQPSEFACATSDRCINMSWRCDGEVDCADSSDEAGCLKNTTSLPYPEKKNNNNNNSNNNIRYNNNNNNNNNTVEKNRLVEIPLDKLYLSRKSDPHSFPPVAPPLYVSVSLSLDNIVSARANRNEVELLTWLTLTWRDPDLEWRDDLDGEGHVTLPADKVWTPDVVVSSLSRPLEPLTPSLLSVNNTGHVTYRTRYRMYINCRLAPLTQHSACHIRLASLTHGADVLVLSAARDTVDVSTYFQGSKYHVLTSSVTLRDTLQATFTFRKK